MLTIFTIPKAFKGHFDVIQRNAIRSWTLLRPECEIILFGDDEGTEEVAREFGVRHIGNVPCTKFGTPRVDSMFHEAERDAKHQLMCHVNADIILMSDFTRAVQQVNASNDWYLMSGQRWNIELDQLLNFEPGWEDRMLDEVRHHGKLGFRTGCDYWVYPRGLLTEIPPFGIGRTCYDQWLFYRAREQKAILVDATPVVIDVHQNHDYSHHQQGAKGVYHGPEHLHNRELVGKEFKLLIIKDRTHVLTPKGLKPARDFWRVWRFLRTAPVLHPDWPLPARLAIKSLNQSINLCRDLVTLVGLVKSHRGPQNMPTN